MSSKRAMRQAQKQAYAKHRSNITNSRFELRKKLITKNFYLTSIFVRIIAAKIIDFQN